MPVNVKSQRAGMLQEASCVRLFKKDVHYCLHMDNHLSSYEHVKTLKMLEIPNSICSEQQALYRN
jgi:hypothetical protein